MIVYSTNKINTKNNKQQTNTQTADKEQRQRQTENRQQTNNNKDINLAPDHCSNRQQEGGLLCENNGDDSDYDKD